MTLDFSSLCAGCADPARTVSIPCNHRSLCYGATVFCLGCVALPELFLIGALAVGLFSLL